MLIAILFLLFLLFGVAIFFCGAYCGFKFGYVTAQEELGTTANHD